MLTLLMTALGVAGILHESQKAFDSEQQAQRDKWQAQQQREIAGRERDEARAQRQLADEQRQLAEAARQAAELAKKKAEEQQVVAEQERTRAQQAQTQAEANLEQAFQTINTFAMFGFNLRHEPEMQEVSKRLLDSTLKLYDDFTQKQGDTSAARRQRIMALIAAGDVRRAMRHSDEAEKLLLQTAQLLDAELEASPSEYHLHQLATGIYWALGVLYKDISRPKESLAAFQRDLVAHDAMLEQRPGDSERIVSKANILTNICIIYRSQERTQEALTTYDEAIAVLRGVLEKLPTQLSAQNELGLVRHDQSVFLNALGRKEQAMEAHAEAFAIRRRLHQLNPKSPAYRSFLARSHRSQATYHRADKNYDASLAEHQAAFALISPLIDQYPDVFEYHLDVINTLAETLETCQVGNNAEMGRRFLDQLVTRINDSLKRFPSDRTLLSLAGTWQIRWSNLLWEEGQKPNAQAAAKQALAASQKALTVTPTPTGQELAGRLNSAAWYLCIAAEPSLRAPPKSVELARRAVELSPQNGNIAHTLGTALYRAGDYPAAREALLKSFQIEQEPAKRGSLDQLADGLKALSQKEASAASDELTTTLGIKRSMPGLAQHFLLLAMTQWKLNDHETARQTLRLVVDPAPGFNVNAIETRLLIAEARELIRSQD
jgi:tetratricopeptide (TPR) repeat protein